MKVYSALLKIKRNDNVFDLNKKEVKTIKILATSIEDALNKIKEEEYEVFKIEVYITYLITGD